MKKTSRKAIRRLLTKNMLPWKEGLRAPPSKGYLWAVRKALGASSRQLAQRLGVSPSSILRLQQREAQGKASLGSLEQAAKAMNCRLVYSIIPQEGFNTLQDIVDQKATEMATLIIQRARHTMALEGQGLDNEETKEDIAHLSSQLKGHHTLWEHIPEGTCLKRPRD